MRHLPMFREFRLQRQIEAQRKREGVALLSTLAVVMLFLVGVFCLAPRGAVGGERVHVASAVPAHTENSGKSQ